MPLGTAPIPKSPGTFKCGAHSQELWLASTQSSPLIGHLLAELTVAHMGQASYPGFGVRGLSATALPVSYLVEV